MRPGNRTATAPGAEADVVRIREIKPLAGGALVRFYMRDADYAQYCRVVVDGQFQGPARWIDDTLTDWPVVHDPSVTLHHVVVCPQGAWGDDFDIGLALYDDWVALHGNRLKAVVTAQPEIFCLSPIASQLTAWSLSGAQRFTNCVSVPGRPHWGQWRVTLADLSGTRTVTLFCGGLAVASGARAGDGALDLEELNDSGLSGSVTVAYSADIDGTLYARWPAAFDVHFKTSAFGSGDFPRTPEGTVSDDGRANSATFRSGPLAAGTYYVVCRQADDDGNESANLDSGGASVTVLEVPAAPGPAVYASGGAAGTVVEFEASATAAASYNIYDSLDTGELEIDTPAATHASGEGTLTQALAALGGDFTGTRFVLIRAILAGVEEGNAQILELEYSAGVVQPSPPNAPGIGAPLATSGRTLSVPFRYQTAGQKAAPTQFLLWIWADGVSQDFGAPSATLASPAESSGVIAGTLQATAPADGDYWFAVRAASAAGAQSANTDVHGPVRLTTSAPPAPAAASVTLGA